MSKKTIGLCLLIVLLVSSAMVAFAEISAAEEKAAYNLGYKTGYERARVDGPPAWNTDAERAAETRYSNVEPDYREKRRAFEKGFIKGWNDKVAGW